MNLYIYYRAACDREPELLKRVTSMQANLSKRHGIVAELKRRPQAQNNQHTWMEIYNSVPSGFDAILAHEVVASGVQALIDGERHTEVFIDATSTPCA
ncbi:MAG: DUF4936 family protein [Burkholderiales bacterium]|nr:DUF4936 family protein [Burkholderiales bacterium]